MTSDGEDFNEDVVEAFKRFYSQFYDERVRELPSMYEEGEAPSLTIDYRKLIQFDEELAHSLTDTPDTVYKGAVRALQEYLENDELESSDLRIANHSSEDNNVINIVNTGRSKNIGKMVTIEGIVKTSSRVLPRVTEAVFVCRGCGTSQSIIQPTNPNRIQYPYECRNDNCSVSSQKSFELDKKSSRQVDFQKIVVEEPPEDIQGGHNPESVNVYIRGDITGEVDPGNRVSVTGVLRSDNTNDNPVFTTFIEGNHVQKEEKEFEEIEITEEDEEKILELAEEEGIYKRIRDSIAPSIYGSKWEKLAMATQLFSGVTKDTDDTYIRGDVHILLIGDPGTGKSVLIQSARRLAPRGVYTVGKGSSSAGLTAAVVRDSDMSGEQKWSLEAGALVLADKGLAAIDEIDKMTDSDRSAMHEALEQQTVSINKAGINATLKSRCSLLAAANPKYGRFDDMEPPNKQINLAPALISRFDLMFTIQDKPEEELDTKIAEHILDGNVKATSGFDDEERMRDDEEDMFENAIDPDLLRKYVAYARQNVSPTLDINARQRIVDKFVELRDNDEGEGPVAVTRRQVQSIVRISEAIARMRLKERVEESDVQIAIKIKMAALEDTGVDPVTGELDADVIETGMSSTKRKKSRKFEAILKELSEEYPEEGAPLNEIAEKAQEEIGMTKSEVEDKLNKLHRSGEVYEIGGNNRYNYIDRD